MIIRGRPKTDFTTIGNALFRDERLAADEVGIMGYLLSLPGDWEVRRPALMRRWKYGRDGLRRVITNLIRTGWCSVQKTRLEGRFHVVYIINSFPGPELTDEELKVALSLESSDAPDEDLSDSNASDAKEGDEPCVPPHTSEPTRLDRQRQSPPGPIEGLQTTNLENTDSTQALWSEVRKLWPIGHMVSPFVCENIFAALSFSDREAAKRGIRSYLTDCHAKTRKVCDFVKYLKERRWEGQAASASSTFSTKGGTPQAFRWLAYRRARGESTAFMEDCWRMGKPYTFPSEWPPALSQDDRTAPVLSPENETDLNSLADELEGRPR